MFKRIAIATGIIAAAMTAPANAGPAAPDVPDVPDNIAVKEAGHKVFLVGHATGVQIYTCDGSAWNFDAPRAVLRDDRGKVVSTHFGGPTWEAKDGSYVVAQRVDGVTVDPSAIPWLLLSRKSSGAGEDGDRLAGTTFIQRVATTGGLAPSPETCTPSAASTTVEVPYTADYYFWKRAD
jgi:hypothetical protein